MDRIESRRCNPKVMIPPFQTFAEAVITYVASVPRSRSRTWGVCAPISQTHISRFFNLQPVIAHTARKQVASLHQLQSLTVHATAWAQYFNLAFTSSGSSPARANTDQQRTIVLLQKKINHKQNIIPWLKGAIYSLMEDIGSLLFVLLQKWALFRDLQKRTFGKGRIMLLQIYVTSFEEETCAGKGIA